MHIFFLKRKLDKEILRIGHFSDKKLARQEKHLSKKIKRKDYNYEKNKKEFSKNVQKLHRRAKRTDIDLDEVLSYDKASIMQTRKAEHTLRREAKTSVETILILNELVKNEDLDIIFDLKQPLDICTYFIRHQLKEIMTTVGSIYYPGNELREKFGKGVIDDITKHYQALLEHTYELIRQEQITIKEAAKYNQLEHRETNIRAALAERTRIKRSITMRIQHIKKALDEKGHYIEKIIKQAKTPQTTREQLEAFLPPIRTMSDYLQNLEKAMLERIEISHQLIIQSITKAQQERTNLAKVRMSIRQLHQNFININRELLKIQQDPEQQALTKKRMKEFVEYKKDITNIFGKFNKDVENVEKEELKLLKKEEWNIERSEKAVKTIFVNYLTMKREAKKIAA